MSHAQVELSGFDRDAFSEVVQGGAFDHRVMGTGRLDAVLDRWEQDDVRVDRGWYGFATLVEGQFRSDQVCVALVSSPGDRCWVNGERFHSNDVQVHREGAELLYRAADDTTWVAIQASRERLQRVARARLGRELELSPTTSIHLRPPTALVEGLNRVVTRVLRETGSAQGEVSDHPELLLDAVVDTLDAHTHGDPHVSRQHREGRLAAVRRALGWIAAHAIERFDSAALCEHVGVPERTLQLAFRECVGSSPSRVHASARLNLARRLLMGRASGPDSTVTSVATRCGFDHLGRFAGEYRRMFGESPSESLARAVAAAG